MPLLLLDSHPDVNTKGQHQRDHFLFKRQDCGSAPSDSILTYPSYSSQTIQLIRSAPAGLPFWFNLLPSTPAEDT